MLFFGFFIRWVVAPYLEMEINDILSCFEGWNKILVFSWVHET